MTDNPPGTTNIIRDVTASDRARVHNGNSYHYHNQVSSWNSAQAKLRQKLLRQKLLRGLNTCPYEERKDINLRRASGTCEWFVNHERFNKWQEETSALLWVSADPGCGKSVLAKHLIDNVLPKSNSESTKICYFFFKDGFDDQTTSEGALCCLLHQLFTKQEDLVSDKLLDLFKIERSRLFKSFRQLWKVLQQTATLNSKKNPKSTIICVVDALDECSNAGPFATALTQLYTDNGVPGLKFLVTSRPYDRIRAAFRTLEDTQPTIHLSGENEEEVEKISEEIILVIGQRIQQIGRKFGLTKKTRKELVDRMSKVGNRTYLWVHLVFADIEAANPLSVDDLSRSVDKMPQTVEAAYDKILSSSGDDTKVQRVLKFVLAAERPLHIREMATALVYLSTSHRNFADLERSLLEDKVIVESLREVCGLFVVVVDHHVHLLHQTAREFLLRPTRSKELSARKPSKSMQLPWRHSFDLEQSHALISRVCVGYLLLIESEQIDTNAEGWRERNHLEFHLLDYAAEHWTTHYRQSETKAGPELVAAAQILCMHQRRTCQVWLTYHKPTAHMETSALSNQNPDGLMIAAHFGLATLVRPMLLAEKSLPVRLAPRKARTSPPQSRGTRSSQTTSESGQYQATTALINRQDSFGRSALWHAACRGHSNVVKVLLECHAESDASVTELDAPLKAAAMCGNRSIIKQLLKHGAQSVNPALYAAAECGHHDCVKLLLKRGGQVDWADKSGRTALMAAVEEDHKKVVTQLLDAGAQIDAVDRGGYTALLLASQHFRREILAQLLEHGASTEVRNSRGFTALMLCSFVGHRAAVAELLLHDAQTEATNNNGDTALLLAAERGEGVIIDDLVEAGANIEATNHDGNTALIEAASRRRFWVVKVLLQRGANVNARNNTGRTALIVAAASGLRKNVEGLLKHGADIHARDFGGQTAISQAQAGSHYTTIRELLAWEAKMPS
ncbi:ankyrin repeat-containing domain protein [Microdochium trichocladiopsis]|uniref:Ankyrin repeat-containing domain protein n=1 Tax=Microdochium trichocladiopsis TaxID=1682393 RepID=A0A9P8YFG4_9PEZI|nr:ankyrin repeat-containing domain protein [Microdochium trichocladiopsis]KAH7035981.1 ankyrin repeat-containing domain protein [Microdochium trichocladiopsis]